MMKLPAGLLSIAMLWLFVLVVVNPQKAAAVSCTPTALAPCLGAIQGNGQPSKECCDKLKEQQPCLCGYRKNPALGPYVSSPNAKKVASTCGVAIPTC